MARAFSVGGLARGLGAGAAVVVLGLAGLALWDRAQRPDAEAPGAPPAVAEAVPEVASAPEADAATEAEPEAGLPRFDLVRVDPESGIVTVAGQARPGARVSVLVDGTEAEAVTADAAGSFAVLFSLDHGDAPRAISLAMEQDEGGAVSSGETLLITALRPREQPVAGPPAEPGDATAEEELAAVEPAQGAEAAEPLAPADGLAAGAAPETDAADLAEAVVPVAEPDQAVAATDPATGRTSDATAAPAAMAEAAGDLAEDLLAAAPADVVPSEAGPVPPAAEAAPAGDRVAAQPEAPAAATPSRETPVAEAPVPEAVAEDAGDEELARQRDGAAPSAATGPAEGVAAAAASGPAGGVDGAGAVTAIAPDGGPDGAAGAVPASDGSATVAAGAAEESGATGEVGAPAMVIVGEGGLRVLPPPDLPGQPREPASVMVDAIGYAETGDVQIAGRGTGGAAVRLYLDNRLVETVAMGAGGDWSSALPQVDTGVYTLRVDEIDAGGAVISRFETPFLREDPAVLAAAAAQPPAPDGADDAALPAGEAPRAQVVTVQPGYTLWGIAERTYGSGFLFVQVFRANRDQIRNPDLIYPGQVFTLPDIPDDVPRPPTGRR